MKTLSWKWILLGTMAFGLAGCGCGDDKKGGGDADSDTDTDTDTGTGEDTCPDMDEDGQDAFACGGEDCDDQDPSIRAGAPDVPGDCVDQNCDGVGAADEDQDGDPSPLCGGMDCDDANPNFGSGAADLVGKENVDENCDGVDGIDADGDGAASISSGGEDCNDGDPTVFPEANDNGVEIVVVDDDGATGYEPSIATGEDGDIHIAYRNATDGDLLYATIEAGEWTTEVIDSDGDTGYDSSLAIDADGTLHVSYRSATERDLRYASKETDGDWELGLFDSPNDSGYYSALAVDSDGAAHIVYRDGTDDALRYITNAGGAWTVEATIDDAEDTGYYPSIAVGDDGYVHVSYSNRNQYLRYASNEGDGWQIDRMESDFGWGPEPKWGQQTSIGLRSDGSVIIAYADGSYIRYTENSSNWPSWYLADTFGESPSVSLGIDAGDGLHLVYSQGDPWGWGVATGLIHMSVDPFFGWAQQVLDPEGGVEGSLSVRTGIQVAYQDEGAAALKFAGALIDGIDQNCDGTDGVDHDGDGVATRETGGGDCDDDDAGIGPGALDFVFDGRDQNCDGVDGVDGDGDGWASEASGGEDCDDEDPAFNPGGQSWLRSGPRSPPPS